MNLSQPFIQRPVLTIIFNCVFVIVGVLAYRNLAVREYPDVSIPILTVNTFYPFASPEVIESEVTFPLEDVLAGMPGIDTVTSNSREGGSFITLAFNSGTSIENAISSVRERLALARDFLPKEVKEPVIEQAANNERAFLHLSVTNPNIRPEQLTHDVQLLIKNQLRAIKGVSAVKVMGQPYTLNIQIDPLKIYTYGVNIEQISDALKAGNVTLPAGKFHKEIPVTLDMSLQTPEEFENLVIQERDGNPVILKDIAQVTIGPDKTQLVRVGGKAGLLIGIVKSSDSNPVTISGAIRNLLPNFQKRMPPGTTIDIVGDEATFIRASLYNIAKSIIEASVLVILIIFLFLQNFRSTFIPLVTIPLSLLGALGIMGLFGFSINTISLLAMVLAVGLVVDDAIVVVENIHRHIEDGLSPFEATKKGSKEIGFAILAMTMTLASVYAPIAFLGGTIGQLFIEFAVTLAGAVIVSGIIAVTLSPMMCARLLKPHERDFFPFFKNAITRLETGYHHLLSSLLSYKKTMISACIIIAAGSTLLYKIVPGEIAPKEDRGFIGVYIESVPGLKLATFENYVKPVEAMVQKLPHVAHTFLFAGDWGAYVGATLTDWSKRKQSADSLVQILHKDVAEVPTISAFPQSWDSGLPGIQNTMDGGGSSQLALSIRTTSSYKELAEQLEILQKNLIKDGILIDVKHDLHLNQPGLRAVVDQHKMATLKLRPHTVAKTLETVLNQSLPGMFRKDGISYPITLDSVHPVENIEEVYVMNDIGERISLGSFVQLVPVASPTQLNHTDQLRSATLTASIPNKMTIAQGTDYLDKKIKELLPEDTIVQYVGAAKMQKEFASKLLFLFFLSIVFIYCILAVLFESFVDPLIVMLTVPLACGGGLLALYLTSESINIFTQIGMITLIGLITKHGILIVDFANRLIHKGESARKAVLHAATQRLRPILMTTAAMLLGILPLVFSSGAGKEARHAIGLVLVGGLLVGTLLTLLVVPTLFLVFKKSDR